ncbi:MAG TPA: carboxypeptidase-like regulatory domain-containing protein, partial [Bacteroidia bacterium]|nr:carboxypeptidase-like regulatory domain-containing protein [Bacteroidia bacterium]
SNAQPKRHQLVSFSGIALEKQSLQPVPFTAIIIKGTSHGTICDYSGYYSFVAQPGDTIEFSAIGYRMSPYFIPDTLSTDRYSLIHLMDKDTANLKEVKIYPWPSKESFVEAFKRLDLPDNDMDRAKRNLALAQRKAQMEGFPIDPQSSFMNSMQQENNKLYYAGQYPPNNLLNPIAWAQFIQAWKAGELKVQ